MTLKEKNHPIPQAIDRISEFLKTAVCTECGKTLHFFQRLHPECERKQRIRLAEQQRGISQITDLTTQTLVRNHSLSKLAADTERIFREDQLTIHQYTLGLVAGWDNAAKQMLSDKKLSDEERVIFCDFRRRFAIPTEFLHDAPSAETILKHLLLQALHLKTTPPKIKSPKNLNLQKNETLYWVFPAATAFKPTVQKEFQGGSQGVSIRLFKGFWYRIGQSRGRVVKHMYSQYLGTGQLIITSKNLYFTSRHSTFKLKNSKILTVQLTTDGLQLRLDRQTDNTFSFQVPDRWFLEKLIQAQLQTSN